MALARGAHLGPYEVVALIGRGAMGEVYRAHDPRLRREIAIKVLARAPDAHHLGLFEREARAAAGLSHPNILAIYDFSAHDEQPFVVSELLEGETLRDRLSHGPLPLKRAIELAAQIASGLAAAHAHGIVHRDLKPGNLFITTEGWIKILDFGIATLAPPCAISADATTTSVDLNLDGAGRVAGTPSYMSPEQVLGEPVDHRSDIFAFGLVFFEMLTGRRAFDRQSSIQAMSAALNEQPPPLATLVPAVPLPIQLIVERCLEKNPNDRFQSTRDLSFSLTLASRDTESVSRRQGPVSPRRSRALRAAGVSLALLTAAAAGIVAGVRMVGFSPPLYQQLTFRRGFVESARFSSDGHTIVYGAEWDGHPRRLWSTRPESPESLMLPFQDADILAISRSGEMAVRLGGRPTVGSPGGGVLARLPLNASAPREVLTGVEDADWAPDAQNLAVAHLVQGKFRLEFPIGTVLYEAVGRISPVRVSRDGSHVAFVDRTLESDDRGAVCVMHVARKRKHVLSGGWSSVTGLAWAPNGDEIWFTAAALGASASLYGVDLAGRVRPIASSGRRMALRDIDQNGRVLLTEGSLRVRIGSVGRPAASEHDLAWLDASIVADVSADGRTLLINEQGAGGGTSLYAVYVRKTDGSPAIRLGDGSSPALSPDGRWAAALLLRSPPSIVLLPTGVGEGRTLRPGTLADYQALSWFPDGRRLLVTGSEAGRAMRLWTVDVQDGSLKAASEEGLRIASFGRPISPDGSRVVALDSSGRLWLITAGMPEVSRPIDGLAPGFLPIAWHTDGESIYVFKNRELPAIVYRFRLDDRRMQRVATLTPPDAAGVRPPTAIVGTADGGRFFYSCNQALSDLFLVDNLR